jgi:hypothetical protein
MMTVSTLAILFVVIVDAVVLVASQGEPPRRGGHASQPDGRSGP